MFPFFSRWLPGKQSNKNIINHLNFLRETPEEGEAGERVRELGLGPATAVLAGLAACSPTRQPPMAAYPRVANYLLSFCQILISYPTYYLYLTQSSLIEILLYFQEALTHLNSKLIYKLGQDFLDSSIYGATIIKSLAIATLESISKFFIYVFLFFLLQNLFDTISVNFLNLGCKTTFLIDFGI